MLAATRTRRTRKRREPAWEDAPKCLSDCDDRDEQRVGTGPAGVRHVRGGRASLESSTERESSALCEVGVVGPGRGRGQGQSMARRRGIAFNVVGFAGKVRTFDAIRRFCYSDTALVRIHSVTLTQVAALVRIHSPGRCVQLAQQMCQRFDACTPPVPSRKSKHDGPFAFRLNKYFKANAGSASRYLADLRCRPFRHMPSKCAKGAESTRLVHHGTRQPLAI